MPHFTIVNSFPIHVYVISVKLRLKHLYIYSLKKTLQIYYTYVGVIENQKM